MQIIASIAGTAAFHKFEAAVGALIPEWRGQVGAPPLLLAVSGGPDSLAMMAMAAACFPNQVAAMTVDHALRAEAADEARFVAEKAAELGVPHSIARPPHPITGNIQANARAARYALLEQEAERLGGAYILTAHHKDDQLETMLMRLARGSGVAGLSGIRPINGRILRPLLGFTKDELRDVCARIGWRPIEDPSNADVQFDRVVMRQALAKCKLPIAPDALSRSTKAMRDADAALDWAVEMVTPNHLFSAPEGGLMLAPATLPHEIVRRLLYTAFATLNQPAPRGEQLETAIAKLHAGEAASLGDILIRPVDSIAPKWHLIPAPPRKVRK